MPFSRDIRVFPLLLLSVSMTAAGLAAAAVANGFDQEMLINNLRPATVFAGVVLAIWLSFRMAHFRGDSLLFAIVVLLTGIGMVVIYRLQPALVEYRGYPAELANRHLVYVVLALVVIWAIALFAPDPERIAHYRYLILTGGIGLLIATAFFGTEVYGARIWIDVGPLLIQPPEFVKLALVFFLASYLAEKGELVSTPWRIGRISLPPLPYLLPVVLMAGACLLILAALNDLGTALLLFAILMVMLYAATARVSYVVIGIGLFLSIAWIGYRQIDRLEIRVSNWIDPWRDPFVAGYQQIQSDYAIATGGVWGTGIGKGNPEYIPVIETDFVVSVIGEEMGLLGALAVLALFVLFFSRGLATSNGCASDVNRLIAIGLTFAVGIQAAIILLGVLRLLPLTGITLPFVSAGGSSLLSNAIAIGFLLRISALRRRERG